MLKLKHIPTLERTEINNITKLIDFMKDMHSVNVLWVKGRDIANYLNFNAITVRSIIQNIRMNNKMFLPDGYFLIATSKGYAISKNTQEIKKFKQQTHIRAIRTLQQIQEIDLTLKKQKRIKKEKKWLK